MQLFQYTIIAVLGLGLAAAVALVYVVLRYSAWTPAGGTPAASARMHGMVTALIALFATGTAGLERLARPEHSGGMDDGHLREVGTYVHEYPLLPLSWPDALIAVASPGVWLFLIYLVAQYSWPRPTAQVRTVRLADRSTVSYLPRTLTLTTAAVMLAAVIATALAWTVSESPARTHEEVLSSDDITHQMSMIYVAKTYNEVYSLFAGYAGGPAGPGNNAITLVYYIYYQFYERQKVNYAAAAALIFLAVILLLTGIQRYISKKFVQYV